MSEEQLRKQLSICMKERFHYIGAYEALQERARKLVEALEFYADISTGRESSYHDIARNVLKELKGEGE